MEPQPTSSEEQLSLDDFEDEQVMSEVHLGCPPRTSAPHVSHFTISLPSQIERGRFDEVFNKNEFVSAKQSICVDEDGDLILTRRIDSLSRSYAVSIRHSITSSIPSVGLQVWKAELVLSDYVLHQMLTSSDFDQIVALELGAGTGLVGILLGKVAKTVFITDRGDEILSNCAENVHLNIDDIKHAAVYVRELDWMNTWPPKEATEKSPAENILGPPLKLKKLSRPLWL